LGVNAILLITRVGGGRKRTPIVLQLGGQKRIKRKPLTINICKSLLEMSQQTRSTRIFARKEVTVS